VRDALLLLVPFGIYVILVRVLTRFRTDRVSWLESWTRAFDPKSYSPQGRKMLPWLYASLLLFAIAVAVVVLTS